MPVSPLPVPAVLADESFQFPRFRGQRNFPHQFLIDLNPQAASLQHLDEPILDSKNFRVCHVAADVVLSSCSAKTTIVNYDFSMVRRDQLLTFHIIVHPNRHLLDLMVGS